MHQSLEIWMDIQTWQVCVKESNYIHQADTRGDTVSTLIFIENDLSQVHRTVQCGLRYGVLSSYF